MGSSELGAVTSIHLGLPGDSSSMIAVLDGHPMAKRGEAGRALGMAVYASFIRGLISFVLKTFLSALIARAALAFGPPEMTALMILATCLVPALGGDDIIKGFAGMGMGLCIGEIGRAS